MSRETCSGGASWAEGAELRSKKKNMKSSTRPDILSRGSSHYKYVLRLTPRSTTKLGSAFFLGGGGSDSIMLFVDGVAFMLTREGFVITVVSHETPNHFGSK